MSPAINWAKGAIGMSKAYSKNQVGFGGPSSRPPPFCTLEGFPLLVGSGAEGSGAEGSGPRDDPGAEGPGAEGSGAEGSVLLAGPGAEGPRDGPGPLDGASPSPGPGARAGDGEFDLTGIPVKLLKEFIKP